MCGRNEILRCDRSRFQLSQFISKMVEIPTYQIGVFVFDLTFSIEKKCAKTRPHCCGEGFWSDEKLWIFARNQTIVVKNMLNEISIAGTTTCHLSSTGDENSRRELMICDITCLLLRMNRGNLRDSRNFIHYVLHMYTVVPSADAPSGRDMSLSPSWLKKASSAVSHFPFSRTSWTPERRIPVGKRTDVYTVRK